MQLKRNNYLFISVMLLFCFGSLHSQLNICDTIVLKGRFAYESSSKAVMLDDMIIREKVFLLLKSKCDKIDINFGLVYCDDYSRKYLLNKCQNNVLSYKFDTLDDFLDRKVTRSFFKKSIEYKVFYVEMKVVYLGIYNSKIIKGKKLIDKKLPNYQIIRFNKIEPPLARICNH